MKKALCLIIALLVLIALLVTINILGARFGWLYTM